jgi:hypothetical protein
MYKLHGLRGEDIPGFYYAEQLRLSAQRPDEETYWEIKPLAPNEKPQEKTIKGEKHVWIEWLYYPKEYGEWRPKNKVVPLLAGYKANAAKYKP